MRHIWIFVSRFGNDDGEGIFNELIQWIEVKLLFKSETNRECRHRCLPNPCRRSFGKVRIWEFFWREKVEMFVDARVVSKNVCCWYYILPVLYSVRFSSPKNPRVIDFYRVLCDTYCFSPLPLFNVEVSSGSKNQSVATSSVGVNSSLFSIMWWLNARIGKLESA